MFWIHEKNFVLLGSPFSTECFIFHMDQNPKLFGEVGNFGGFWIPKSRRNLYFHPCCTYALPMDNSVSFIKFPPPPPHASPFLPLSLPHCSFLLAPVLLPNKLCLKKTEIPAMAGYSQEFFWAIDKVPNHPQWFWCFLSVVGINTIHSIFHSRISPHEPTCTSHCCSRCQHRFASFSGPCSKNRHSSGSPRPTSARGSVSELSLSWCPLRSSITQGKVAIMNNGVHWLHSIPPSLNINHWLKLCFRFTDPQRSRKSRKRYQRQNHS